MEVLFPDSGVLLVFTAPDREERDWRELLPPQVPESGGLSDPRNYRLNKHGFMETMDFAILLHVVERKCITGALCIINAQHLDKEQRRKLHVLARQHHVPLSGLVLIGNSTGRREYFWLQQIREQLRREKYYQLEYVLLPRPEEILSLRFGPLPNDRRGECGPFDIIGDVHGCLSELKDLLHRLGYTKDRHGSIKHPEGRKLVFLGDYCDRGPDTPGVYELVMALAGCGVALCLPGNHDVKLLRWLNGKSPRIRFGLETSVQQFAARSKDFHRQVAEFIAGLPDHYVLDKGNLVVAHAGLRADLHGRYSHKVQSFALYGDTDGTTDELGLPVRRDWAQHYNGTALVVYGHTPVADACFRNNTMNIDTGCVFGGALSALRYPERQVRAVPAQKQYAVPRREFLSDE